MRNLFQKFLASVMTFVFVFGTPFFAYAQDTSQTSNQFSPTLDITTATGSSLESQINDSLGEELTPPFGLNGGLRYEPGVGWQIYSSNSVGLGIGASVKYDPNGHLDQEVRRGDTYSQKEFVVAPIIGGYTSTSVIENPMDPFNFSDNPKKSKGLAFGLEVGATYSTEHEGSVNQIPKIMSNFSSVLQTTIHTTNSAISQVRSAISSAVQNGAIKIGNAIGSFIGTYNFGGNVGSYDTSTGKWK